MYTNYYGCDKYPMGIYTNDQSQDEGRLGGITYCAHPQAQPWTSAAFSISFIFVTSFCMLALFIGAVTMSMAEGIAVMKMEKENRRKTEKFEQKETRGLRRSSQFLTAEERRCRKAMALAFSGAALEDETDRMDPPDGTWIGYVTHWYLRLARQCAIIAHHTMFRNFITLCIMVSAVEVSAKQSFAK